MTTRDKLRTLLLLLLMATAIIFAALASAACADDAASPSGESAPAPAATTAAPPAATPAATGVVADETDSVAAAQAFLGTLTAEQRVVALLALDDPARPNWSNLPAGALRRNGVRIGDLNDAQAAAMHQFLAAALSADGYATIVGIVGAEAALAQTPGAAGRQWSADNYWLAFFGEPSAGSKWGWQFGGHHLAVNVTVVAGRSYLSPTFLGIEPASFTSGGTTVAPLDAHLQAGLALINALDERARTDATIPSRPRELWAGAGRDGMIPPLEGAKVADWNAAQQQSLLDTIMLWVGLLDATSSEARMTEIRADLASTHFAWHGPMDGSGSIYYRIQGPNLILEFGIQGNMGSDAGHYHSVYRNPSNEYGTGV